MTALIPESHTKEMETAATVAQAMLRWYDRSARALPWRAPPGTAQDPYQVWLSEIMLQQTTVKAVAPRYLEVLRRWPDVKALAHADLEEVLGAWAGLGYYARARNLHACARVVTDEFDGRFPDTEIALRRLPGVGPYTAAAIAAIAFGHQATPVDGNIERVVARLFAVDAPLPASKPEIKSLAETLTPAKRAGDFAQSMMDLGATICTPRQPACPQCPVRPHCRGHAAGIAARLPYKQAKGERPTRRGAAFVVFRTDGAVLLRARPLRGLLGGMLEVPSTPWTEVAAGGGAIETAAPIEAAWERVPGEVEHTFTHFHLKLVVYCTEAPGDTPLTAAAEHERCRWVAERDLAGAALPSVMRKVLVHASKGKASLRPPAPASPARRRANDRSA